MTTQNELVSQNRTFLDFLKLASKSVFFPLVTGGDIRNVTDPDGTVHPALEVTGKYFRSGAGSVEDFVEVLEKTNVEVSLAASIFHHKEVPVEVVKLHLKSCDIPVRPIETTVL